MARWPRAPMILAALMADPATGAGIERLAISHDKGIFRIELQARMDAPPSTVYGLLTDYDHLDRLSPGIGESQRLDSAPPGEIWVRTVTEGCVAFFCRELERVIQVQEHPERRLTTKVLPDRRDFRSGRARLRIIPGNGGSRLEYRARMTPDIWIPPIVGAWQVKRNVRWKYRRMVIRLEQLGSGPGPQATSEQPVPSTSRPEDLPDPLGGKGP